MQDNSLDSQQSHDARETDYWLTQAPIMKAIAHMAVPMILGMMAMSIYNFTDTLFVGMLDDTAALAALPLAMPVISLFLASSLFFEVGSGTFVARSVGAGDLRASRSASAYAIIGCSIAGIITATILALFMDPLLSILGAHGETYATAKSYISIFCLGAPFAILNMVGAQLVRSIAKSKEASLGVAGSAIINIILDPILIFVLGLGLEGAALATVISNAAAAIYYLFIITDSDALSISPQSLSLTMSHVIEISKVGTSALLMALLMGVSSLVFNNVAILYGAEVVAAFGISQSVVQLLELVTMGLYEGVGPLIGGSWGAGNMARLREIVKDTSLCLAIFCLLACGVVIMFAQTIVGLFSGDPAVLEVGIKILIAQMLAVPLAAGSGLVMGILQACGKGLFANILSVITGCACIPCVIVGSMAFGVDGIAWSLLAYEAIAFLVSIGLLVVAFRKKTVLTN